MLEIEVSHDLVKRAYELFLEGIIISVYQSIIIPCLIDILPFLNGSSKISVYTPRNLNELDRILQRNLKSFEFEQNTIFFWSKTRLKADYSDENIIPVNKNRRITSSVRRLSKKNLLQSSRKRRK
jgi:hypothetical protein